MSQTRGDMVSDNLLSTDQRLATDVARKPKRLPVVMTREEVKAVLGQLKGSHFSLA